MRGYQPGTCGICGDWLRDAAASDRHRATADSAHLWRSKAIWELVARRPEASNWKLSHVAGAFRQINEHLFDGNANRMVQHLGFSKSHISMSINGLVVPTVESLLNVSYAVGISLVQFYEGQTIDPHFLFLRDLSTDVRRVVRRREDDR